MSQLQNIIISLAIMATLRHNGRGALKQKKRAASVEKPSTPKGIFCPSIIIGAKMI